MITEKKAPPARIQSLINRLNPEGDDLDIEQLALRAIDVLPEPPYIGFHCVWTGFNEMCKFLFPDRDPCAELKALGKRGVISVKPWQGGAIIGPPKR